MPRNISTGVFTRVSNSFSNPVYGTVIDPTDADALFDDYDGGLTFDDTEPLQLVGSTSGALTILAPDTASGTITFPAGTTDFSATGGTGQFVRQDSAGAPFTVSTVPASAIASGAALTRVDDTNVTLTLGGTPSTALLAAASITAGWTGQLSLTRGGTNASLSASNGGLLYSTASELAILAGTATAGQIPRSGASSAPSWSTATFPATTAAGTVLASATANTVAGTATPVLGVPGTTLGTLGLAGSTSGTVTITPQATAGTTTLTAPNTSGTIAASATAPITLDATTGAIGVTGSALTRVDDTNVTLTLGGTPSTALLAATSLTLGWSGQLALSRGGTGISSGTSGGILGFTASGTLASSAALGQYGVVIGGGAGATPTAITAGTDGQLLLGVTSAAPAMASMSGGATITNAGVVTLAQIPDTSGTPSASFGAVKVDGTTITAAGGVLTAIGGAASDVAVGTTTVSSGTSSYLLYNNAGVVGNRTIASVLTAGSGMAVTGTTNATLALAAKAAFSANKGGTDQTGVASNTLTQITFNTEAYDTGGFFASNAWVPPAGLVNISSRVAGTGTIAAGALSYMALYKNGSQLVAGVGTSSSGLAQASINTYDRANGTDSYTIYFLATTTSGTVTVLGTSFPTYFQGAWLSP